MIDVAKIKYDFMVLTPQGQKLHPFCRALSYSENNEEISVRLEAEIQNQQLSSGAWLHQQVPLGGQVYLYTDWGAGWQEVFRGTVFNWHYRTDPLGHFTITAYDPLIFLAKSKDDRYYKAGTTAKQIIQDIAGVWGVPLGAVEGPDTALSKQVFRGRTLADMIFNALDQVKKRGGGKWIARSAQGKIDVVRPGQNNPVFHFGAGDTVGEIEDQQDIEDLVTRVKIVGAEDKEGKSPVVAKMDGRTEFGVLQELVYQEQYDNPAAAQAAAKEMLVERGQPRKRRRVAAPDLPFLRRGDKVHVTAGTLIGYYLVSSVVHYATTATMIMEVEDVD